MTKTWINWGPACVVDLSNNQFWSTMSSSTAVAVAITPHPQTNMTNISHLHCHTHTHLNTDHAGENWLATSSSKRWPQHRLPSGRSTLPNNGASKCCLSSQFREDSTVQATADQILPKCAQCAGFFVYRCFHFQILNMHLNNCGTMTPRDYAWLQSVLHHKANPEPQASRRNCSKHMWQPDGAAPRMNQVWSKEPMFETGNDIGNLVFLLINHHEISWICILAFKSAI